MKTCRALRQLPRLIGRAFSEQKSKIHPAIASLQKAIEGELSYEYLASQRGESEAMSSQAVLSAMGFKVQHMADLETPLVKISKHFPNENFELEVVFDARSPSQRIDEPVHSKDKPIVPEEAEERAFQDELRSINQVFYEQKKSSGHKFEKNEEVLLNFGVYLHKPGQKFSFFVSGTTNGKTAELNKMQRVSDKAEHEQKFLEQGWSGVISVDQLEEEHRVVLETIIRRLGLDEKFYKEIVELAIKKDQSLYIRFLSQAKALFAPAK